MKIQSINNNYNVSHKAYFKPNTNFHILYGREIESNCVNPKLVKKIKELPNHELEILKLSDSKNNSKNLIDEIDCVVLNNETKQIANINLINWTPFNELLEKIVALKDNPFFTRELSVTDKMCYDDLTKNAPSEVAKYMKD